MAKSDQCKEQACSLESVYSGFCRLHYIKYWKCIKLGIDPFDTEKREMLFSKNRGIDETLDKILKGDDFDWESLNTEDAAEAQADESFFMVNNSDSNAEREKEYKIIDQIN